MVRNVDKKYSLVDILGWKAMISIGGPNRSFLLSKLSEWRIDSLCLPSNSCTEIHHLPIDIEAARDYWKWQLDPVGNFPLKSAWNTVIPNSSELD